MWCDGLVSHLVQRHHVLCMAALIIHGALQGTHAPLYPLLTLLPLFPLLPWLPLLPLSPPSPLNPLLTRAGRGTGRHQPRL